MSRNIHHMLFRSYTLIPPLYFILHLLLICNGDDGLARVLPRQDVQEHLARLLEPTLRVLQILDLARGHLRGNVLVERRAVLGFEISDDKAVYG